MTERECELIARRVAELIRPEEPWLRKAEVAKHFGCSTRSIEAAMAHGLPSTPIFGRPKFRVSEVDPWLREHGYVVDGGCTVVADSVNGAATADTAPPHDQGGNP